MSKQGSRIRTGGFRDPVAQTIRNQHMRDAAAGARSEQQRQHRVAKRMAILAEEGIFLKDRTAVQAAASERDWEDVSTKADFADDGEWKSLIKSALDIRDD